MILCVILLWPSKIKNSLILMQNVFNVWFFEDKLIQKLCFWKIWVEFMCFWKNFKIILMHSWNMVFWVVFALTCSVFQKIYFSRFSINRSYCSTDQKCDKNFGYNLSGSIGIQLMLDWSNMFFDWSKLIFDRSKIN